MSRFITGDELGSLKVLRYSADAENKTELKTVHDGSATGKLKTVQRLGITSTFNGSKLVGHFFWPRYIAYNFIQRKLAAALADGSTSAFMLHPDDSFEQLDVWKETRFKPDQSYVGLAAFDRCVTLWFNATILFILEQENILLHIKWSTSHVLFSRREFICIPQAGCFANSFMWLAHCCRPKHIFIRWRWSRTLVVGYE